MPNTGIVFESDSFKKFNDELDRFLKINKDVVDGLQKIASAINSIKVTNLEKFTDNIEKLMKLGGNRNRTKFLAELSTDIKSVVASLNLSFRANNVKLFKQLFEIFRDAPDGKQLATLSENLKMVINSLSMFSTLEDIDARKIRALLLPLKGFLKELREFTGTDFNLDNLERNFIRLQELLDGRRNVDRLGIVANKTRDAFNDIADAYRSGTSRLDTVSRTLTATARGIFNVGFSRDGIGDFLNGVDGILRRVSRISSGRVRRAERNIVGIRELMSSLTTIGALSSSFASIDLSHIEQIAQVLPRIIGLFTGNNLEGRIRSFLGSESGLNKFFAFFGRRGAFSQLSGLNRSAAEKLTILSDVIRQLVLVVRDMQGLDIPSNIEETFNSLGMVFTQFTRIFSGNVAVTGLGSLLDPFRRFFGNRGIFRILDTIPDGSVTKIQNLVSVIDEFTKLTSRLGKLKISGVNDSVISDIQGLGRIIRELTKVFTGDAATSGLFGRFDVISRFFGNRGIFGILDNVKIDNIDKVRTLGRAITSITDVLRQLSREDIGNFRPEKFRQIGTAIEALLKVFTRTSVGIGRLRIGRQGIFEQLTKVDPNAGQTIF